MNELRQLLSFFLASNKLAWVGTPSKELPGSMVDGLERAGSQGRLGRQPLEKLAGRLDDLARGRRRVREDITVSWGLRRDWDRFQEVLGRRTSELLRSRLNVGVVEIVFDIWRGGSYFGIRVFVVL